jgi:hypothetical protein
MSAAEAPELGGNWNVAEMEGPKAKKSIAEVLTQGMQGSANSLLWKGRDAHRVIPNPCLQLSRILVLRRGP